jgi:hypothetical protein
VIENMVARDGYPLHSTVCFVPLRDIYLDSRLEPRYRP